MGIIPPDSEVVGAARRAACDNGLNLSLRTGSIHDFYAGKIGLGILCIVFCWTFIQAIVAPCKTSDAYERIAIKGAGVMGSIRLDEVELIAGSGGAHAPLICVIDLPEHPFPIEAAAAGMVANVARIPVHDWDDALTPWEAEGLRPSQTFGGHAAETLTELTGAITPKLIARKGIAPEKLAICSYSLGGLFALWAFVNDTRFAACACLSGSVWYPGWVNYLRGADIDGINRFAFFSVGSKEKRGAGPFRHVEDDIQASADILRDHGCNVRFEIGPGNHMQHVTERLAAGLTALDAFLA